MSAIFELRKLRFAWTETNAIFEGLDLDVSAGDRLVLLGPNGCGKSTLLLLLNGLLHPSEGTIQYRGQALTPAALSKPGFVRTFRREVALLFQDPQAMFFNGHVLDEIAFGPRQFNLPAPEEVARFWAGRFDLRHLHESPPHLLSGGQKQRLALACLFAIQPRVLLLDEPTAHLDARSAAALIELLIEETDRTLVFSTHNLALATRLATRVLALGPCGAVIAQGPATDVLADHQVMASAGLVF